MIEGYQPRKFMGIMQRVRDGDWSHLDKRWQAGLAEFAAKRRKATAGKSDDGSPKPKSQTCRIGGKVYKIALMRNGKKLTCGGRKRVQLKDAAKVQALRDSGGDFEGKIAGKPYNVNAEMLLAANKMGVSQLMLAAGRVPLSVQTALRRKFNQMTTGETVTKPKVEPKPATPEKAKQEPATKTSLPNWSDPPEISTAIRDEALAFISDYNPVPIDSTAQNPAVDSFYSDVIKAVKGGDPKMTAVAVAMQWIGSSSIKQSAKMVAAMQKYSPEIPTTAGVILNSYSSTAFTQINGMLRQTPPSRWGEEEKAVAWAMKNALSEMPRTAPGTTLYRGVKLFDPYDDYADEGAPTTSDYVVGEVISERGVASTSKSRRQAEGFASGYGTTPGLFIIKQKEGGAGADLSGVSDQTQEQEVAFPPLTNFVVKKRTMVDGVIEIELEEL